MDRAAFFTQVRKERASHLTTKQVEGFEKILDEGLRRKVPLNQMASILGQSWLETAYTMQPVREYGTEAYLKSKKYYPWVGEGLIQVTWEENARKFGATAPGQLMDWPIALRALFDGMLLGMFTKYKLADFVNSVKSDYAGARRVVNGMDRADQVASFSRSFERALKAMDYTIEAAAVVPPAVEPPVVVPPIIDSVPGGSGPTKEVVVMNTNLFRSILSVVAVIVGFTVPWLGCSTLTTGDVDCSGTWVPAPWNLLVSPALVGLGILIKAFGGSGTASENLAKPAVPVVEAAKPGTVTPAQVASH